MPPTLGNGKICYIEIPATDVPRSATFYSRVFNWSIRQRGDGATAFDDTVGQVSGAWVLKGTRMPVQTIFENLEAGLSVKEITEIFDVTEEEVRAVLHFAAQSLEKAPAHG